MLCSKAQKTTMLQF